MLFDNQEIDVTGSSDLGVNIGETGVDTTEWLSVTDSRRDMSQWITIQNTSPSGLYERE